MSRLWRSAGSVGGGFPRVSGDEPVVSLSLDSLIEFSPRERG